MVMLIVIVVAIGVMVLVYNGMVRRRIDCDNAWSQIDIQLKRRHDLIPNLVETVKGYASHEQKTLEAVIAARNSAMNARASGGVEAAAQAENMLSSTLKSLFALSENYPQLKANENFLKLQEEISSTENRIGFSRQHYNDSVSAYQSSIQTFPGNLMAGFFRFTSRPFFELDQTEAQAVREVPQVKF